MSGVSKSWVFTLNNPMEQEKAFFMALEASTIVVGEEVGESGTPHLQGFVTFSHAMRLTALKKLSPRAHWEQAKSKEAAANYCMKEKILRKEGFDKKRKASEVALEMAQSHKTVREIVEAVPALSLQVNNLQRLVSLCATPNVRDGPPEIIWVYGNSGVGKTRYAMERYPDLNEVTFQGHFLMNYDPAAAVVLIDDVKFNTVPFDVLLRILDRYPNRSVAIKGGSVRWNPSTVIVTSIGPPEKVVPFGEDPVQLTRRISTLIHLE